MIPNHAKYLLWCASEDIPNEETKFRKLSKYQKSELLRRDDLNSWDEIISILNANSD